MLLPLLQACASGSASSSGDERRLSVVAAENFWGSVATQLGGSHVTVTSVVTGPAADPHEYESSTKDARAFAEADYVILNGAGYDDWGKKLLASTPSGSRKVLVIADLLGMHAGDNPHFWYSPNYVGRVADKITADYKSLDSAAGPGFDRLRANFATALRPYQQKISSMATAFRGLKVAATEDIFVYLAQALGLDLISPPTFMRAVAEGNEPPAPSVIAFQTQLSSHLVRILVFNVQTQSAVTNNIQQSARRLGIPVVGISETLQPPEAKFQDWQLNQLVAIEQALRA